MKYLRIICTAALLISCFLPAAYAGYYFEGVRSTNNADQLVTDDAWAGAYGGFQISFSAEYISTGNYWKYTYEFNDADTTALKPVISKFFKLQVSSVNDAWYRLENGTQLTVLTDAGFHLWDAPASDPVYSLGTYIKIDDLGELSDGIVTILSSQAPMWGSFYARGGYIPYYTNYGPAEAVNRGFNDGEFPAPSGTMLSSVGSAPAFDPNQDMNSADFKYWILVPDTKTTVPEGGSTLLFLAIAIIPIALSCRLWRS
ncbi:MAG: hypothetical protein JXA73_23910 [Acidobacteria bacterium]|nr:hypothetical protein [Acidobacteriota bacterium]